MRLSHWCENAWKMQAREQTNSIVKKRMFFKAANKFDLRRVYHGGNSHANTLYKKLPQLKSMFYI